MLEFDQNLSIIFSIYLNMPSLMRFSLDPIVFQKKDFVAAYGQDLVVVQEMMKNMKGLFGELVEYYCLDPKKTNMDEFFAVIYKFILEYQVSELSTNSNRSSHFFSFLLFQQYLHAVSTPHVVIGN